MLERLDKGPRSEIHVTLFEKELAILDALARRYSCSRAAILGEMIFKLQAAEFGDMPEPRSDGRKSRRR